MEFHWIFQNTYFLNQPTVRNKQKQEIIRNEIKSLLDKKVIRETQLKEGGYNIHSISTEKSDNTNRLILNLKKLNGNIACVHFKMGVLTKCYTFDKTWCVYGFNRFKRCVLLR